MDTLKNKAIEVLNNNWKEGYSIPCANLYPFQWFWDSGLIAIGLAHYDMTKAEKEISTLLDGQWGNGFIPHIIFHVETDSYFPGADFHLSNLHPLASKKHKSSGITQPPVTGFVLEELYRISNDKKATLKFIESVIDKVYFNHQYFYNQRDPKNEGLVYIYHNWESGTDNSPIWDDIWETMNPPDYNFERKDTTHIDASQRPTKREYDHYVHLIEIAKSHNYDDTKIAELSPFLVQDPLFNAILIKSNESLIKLYKRIGANASKISQIEAWQNKAKRTFNSKLFDEELGLCASFDPTSERFNPKKYWRGPVWINLNWILYSGLDQYGFTEIAERIKQDTIEIIEENGFYEYFDSRKDMHKNKKGRYGGTNFSWSAALLIDLINR